MKQFVTGMLVALLAVAVYSCTTTGGGGGGGPLMKIGGRAVTAEEFMTSPVAKQAVGQFVMMEAMKNEAKKNSVVVDEKKLSAEIEDYKKNVTMQGQKWEDVLEQSGQTEKEFVDEKRTQMLYEALLEKLTPISEEEIKKAWESEKESIIAQYATENHLPDSEKAKLTLEQLKEQTRERVMMTKKGLTHMDVMSDIVLSTKLEIPAIKDAARAKHIVDTIMKPMVDMAEEHKKNIAAAKETEEGGDADKAEGDAAAEGEGAAADEAVPPGEEVPAEDATHDEGSETDHGHEHDEAEGDGK